MQKLSKRHGLSNEEIRSMPILELQSKIEKTTGHKIKIKSYFPLIGRGSVHHDSASHDEIEEIVTNFINLKK